MRSKIRGRQVNLHRRWPPCRPVRARRRREYPRYHGNGSGNPDRANLIRTGQSQTPLRNFSNRTRKWCCMTWRHKLLPMSQTTCPGERLATNQPSMKSVSMNRRASLDPTRNLGGTGAKFAPSLPFCGPRSASRWESCVSTSIWRPWIKQNRRLSYCFPVQSFSHSRRHCSEMIGKIA